MEHQVFSLAPLSTAAHWSFAGLITFLIVIMLFIWQKKMPQAATSVSVGLVIATVGFFGWMYWQASNANVVVEQAQLQIEMPLYSRSIPIRALNLTEAKVVDMNSQNAPQLSWRTNGVGLPGYHLGWFQLKQDGKALVAISEPQQVLYIPTEQGFSLLLSVPAATDILIQLRQRSAAPTM